MKVLNNGLQLYYRRILKVNWIHWKWNRGGVYVLLCT